MVVRGQLKVLGQQSKPSSQKPSDRLELEVRKLDSKSLKNSILEGVLVQDMNRRAMEEEFGFFEKKFKNRTIFSTNRSQNRGKKYK